MKCNRGGARLAMGYGVALPDKILEKVYHQNAEKIFAMYREEK